MTIKDKIKKKKGKAIVLNPPKIKDYLNLTD